MSEPNKSWFRIRKLGWTPCSWQGWVAVAIYIALMMYALDISDTSIRRLCGAALTIGLIGVAMWKTDPRKNANG